MERTIRAEVARQLTGRDTILQKVPVVPPDRLDPPRPREIVVPSTLKTEADKLVGMYLESLYGAGPKPANGQGCLKCHEPGANGGLVPTRVSNVWFQSARFNHAAHRAMNCAECHDKAAKDFSDINFFVYHSGLQGVTAPKPTGEVPWTTEFCEMKKKEPGIQNIYMELGSTFGQLVTTNPTACAHLLGQMIAAFGADHVLWGTDSIWWGSPQWQIEAFRRFTMPDSLIKRFGYAPLSPDVKAQILGAGAARVYGIDPAAHRNPVPPDFVSKLKAAYREEGARPSLTQYGWVLES